MTKYKITKEDNHFYEDDYHDMHGVDVRAIGIALLFGFVALYAVIRLFMLL